MRADKAGGLPAFRGESKLIKRLMHALHYFRTQAVTNGWSQEVLHTRPG